MGVYFAVARTQCADAVAQHCKRGDGGKRDFLKKVGVYFANTGLRKIIFRRKKKTKYGYAMKQ